MLTARSRERRLVLLHRPSEPGIQAVAGSRPQRSLQAPAALREVVQAEPTSRASRLSVHDLDRRAPAYHVAGLRRGATGSCRRQWLRALSSPRSRQHLGRSRGRPKHDQVRGVASRRTGRALPASGLYRVSAVCLWSTRPRQWFSSVAAPAPRLDAREPGVELSGSTEPSVPSLEVSVPTRRGSLQPLG